MFLQAGDAISGKEGKAFATIDGKVVELFEIKNYEATATKKKAEFNSLGHRGTQYKTTGWSGKGSMNIYYVTSRWVKMMLDYIKKGKDTYFKMVVTNEDPTSSTGKQTVALIDCNIDETTLAKLDVDAEFLDEPVNFTFSDADLLDEFNELK